MYYKLPGAVWFWEPFTELIIALYMEYSAAEACAGLHSCTTVNVTHSMRKLRCLVPWVILHVLLLQIDCIQSQAEVPGYLEYTEIPVVLAATFREQSGGDREDLVTELKVISSSSNLLENECRPLCPMPTQFRITQSSHLSVQD